MTDGALQISCLHPYAKKKSAGGSQRCVAGAAPVTGRFSDAADRRSGKERRRLAGGTGATRYAKSPPLHHPRCRAHGASMRREALLDLAQPELVPDFLRQNNRYGHPAKTLRNAWKSGNPLVFHGGGRRDTGACWKEKSENKTIHTELKIRKNVCMIKEKKPAKKKKPTIKQTNCTVERTIKMKNKNERYNNIKMVKI